MAADPTKVAARYIQAGVWYDDYHYDDMLSDIPEDQYGSWDAAVHSGYTDALREMEAFLDGRTRKSPLDIIQEYKRKLDSMSRVPGTKKPLDYARKHGLGSLHQVLDLLNEAEALRDKARGLIRESL